MVWTGTDEDPPFFHDHPTMGPMVRLGYAVFVQPAIWVRKNVVEPARTGEPEAWYHRSVYYPDIFFADFFNNLQKVLTINAILVVLSLHQYLILAKTALNIANYQY